PAGAVVPAPAGFDPASGGATLTIRRALRPARVNLLRHAMRFVHNGRVPELPDAETLMTLLTLHETGSESAAAEVLGVGQSSVSRRIATLQRLSPEPLTVRTATGTKLTPAGQRLLPFAREARAALLGAARWLSAGERVGVP